jgi:hypothetical protein
MDTGRVLKAQVRVVFALRHFAVLEGLTWSL